MKQPSPPCCGSPVFWSGCKALWTRPEKCGRPRPAIVPHAGGVAGFTVIELMIELAVAAVLLTIAVPSFRDFIVSRRLAAAADSLVSAIDAARMAAIQRNDSAQFCGDLTSAQSAVTAHPTDPFAQGCASNAAGPGAVYIVTGTGSAAQASQVLAPSSGLAALQWSGSVQALRCNSLGVCSSAGSATPYNDDVAVLCSSQLAHNNRYTISMTSGSFTQITRSTGNCS